MKNEYTRKTRINIRHPQHGLSHLSIDDDDYKITITKDKTISDLEKVVYNVHMIGKKSYNQYREFDRQYVELSDNVIKRIVNALLPKALSSYRNLNRLLFKRYKSRSIQKYDDTSDVSNQNDVFYRTDMLPFYDDIGDEVVAYVRSRKKSIMTFSEILYFPQNDILVFKTHDYFYPFLLISYIDKKGKEQYCFIAKRRSILLFENIIYHEHTDEQFNKRLKTLIKNMYKTYEQNKDKLELLKNNIDDYSISSWTQLSLINEYGKDLQINSK